MRNVHFTTTDPDLGYSPQPTQEQHSLPRLRERTNDPLTEYAHRPGQVAPISDTLAACILSKKGYAIVERHQIKVQLDNETYYFTAPDSITIATKNGTGERVAWYINRQKPDALHIFTDLGEYVETLPLKGEATWFSNDAESKRAIAAARSMQTRDMTRMQELHKPDTRKAVADATHNAAEIQRVVSTFPVAGSDRQTPADRPQADRIIAPDREPFTTPRADAAAAIFAGAERARQERFADAVISEEELADL
jgi:hypothetical protein